MQCHHYCEPFGGSAALLLNRAPAPVETYNDLDGEVCNFFRVLRDESKALTRLIGLTPFSREEFGIACTLDPDASPVERARRFYVRARQVRTGLAQTASMGRWANCKNTTRAGMSGVVSRWFKHVSPPRTNHATKGKRIEVPWTNYDLRKILSRREIQEKLELA